MINRLLLWSPFVSGMATVILATYLSCRLMLGYATPELINEWVFYLLTTFVFTLFLDTLIARTLSRKGFTEGDSSSHNQGYLSVLRSGIVDIDMGGQRVTKVLDQISAARLSVLKIGIALSNTCSREQTEFWRQQLRRIKINIMVVDPDWLESQPDLLIVLSRHLMRDSKILVAQIRETLGNLQHVSSTLPAELRARLHVRTYQAIPTMNLTYVDRESHDARILIELLPYGCGFRGRPHLLLRPTDAGWFQSFHDMGKALWDAGTDITTEK